MRPVMVARRNFVPYDSPIRSAGRGAVLHWSGTPFQMKASEGHSIRVRASAGDYSVACRPGILRQAGRAIEKLGVFTSVHILSSPKVWRFVGRAARKGISAAREPQLHLFDDGGGREESADRRRNNQKIGASRRRPESTADRGRWRCRWRRRWIRGVVLPSRSATRAGAHDGGGTSG